MQSLPGGNPPSGAVGSTSGWELLGGVGAATAGRAAAIGCPQGPNQHKDKMRANELVNQANIKNAEAQTRLYQARLAALERQESAALEREAFKNRLKAEDVTQDVIEGDKNMRGGGKNKTQKCYKLQEPLGSVTDYENRNLLLEYAPVYLLGASVCYIGYWGCVYIVKKIFQVNSNSSQKVSDTEMNSLKSRMTTIEKNQNDILFNQNDILFNQNKILEKLNLTKSDLTLDLE